MSEQDDYSIQYGCVGSIYSPGTHPALAEALSERPAGCFVPWSEKTFVKRGLDVDTDHSEALRIEKEVK